MFFYTVLTYLFTCMLTPFLPVAMGSKLYAMFVLGPFSLLSNYMFLEAAGPGYYDFVANVAYVFCAKFLVLASKDFVRGRLLAVGGWKDAILNFFFVFLYECGVAFWICFGLWQAFFLYWSIWFYFALLPVWWAILLSLIAAPLIYALLGIILVSILEFVLLADVRRAEQIVYGFTGGALPIFKFIRGVLSRPGLEALFYLPYTTLARVVVYASELPMLFHMHVVVGLAELSFDDAIFDFLPERLALSLCVFNYTFFGHLVGFSLGPLLILFIFLVLAATVIGSLLYGPAFLFYGLAPLVELVGTVGFCQLGWLMEKVAVWTDSVDFNFLVRAHLTLLSLSKGARVTVSVYTRDHVKLKYGPDFTSLPTDPFVLRQLKRKLLFQSNPSGQLMLYFFLIILYFFFYVNWLVLASGFKGARKLLRFIYALTLAMVPLFLPSSFYLFFIIPVFGTLGKYRHIRDMIFKCFVDILKFFSLWTVFGIRAGLDRISELKPDLENFEEELGKLPTLVFPGTQNIRRLPVSKIFKFTLVSYARRAVLRGVEAVDSFRLPEFVQAQYKAPTIDSIRSTYVTLQDMGFPVDQVFIDSLVRPDDSRYLAEWGSLKTHLLGSTKIELGFPKVSISQQSWVPKGPFYPEYPPYILSASFTGVKEEIAATSRYFTGNYLDHIDNFDELVQDTWEVFRHQFQNSQLASPSDIFRKWKKSYNFGFGFWKVKGKKLSRWAQMSRQEVIQKMGGKGAFLEKWAELFKVSAGKFMPAPVFTKFETLKLKKAISRSVRTVVGSPFVHHVATTIFNYKPNHVTPIWVAPPKVGMPLNGQNFDVLWTSLCKHDKVWAGDMTAFDSSQPPVIIKVAREIRKKGYEFHRDYDKICELIDISYEVLRDQPMGFKYFGSISGKGQGFTTGHSSTTADNSIALVVNYLYAWRRVTGLRAREFLNFNTLANYGDDHVLGYDEVFGWNPASAMKAMAELGTVMRDEAPGVTKMPGVSTNKSLDELLKTPFSFLAKVPIPLTSEVRNELAEAGVRVNLNFATAHDPARLLGKAKGFVNSKKLQPHKSYASLVSYLYLCAHNKPVFDQLAKQAGQMWLWNRKDFIRQGHTKTLRKPPTYNEVLRAWYAKEPLSGSPEAPLQGEYLDEDFVEGFEILEQTDSFGLVVRWISDLPTLISPRYTNLRWADWLQTKLAKRLSWPLQLVATANGFSDDIGSSKLLMARSIYGFLRSENIGFTQDNYASLVLRNWLYHFYHYIFARKRSNIFSVLDLVRVADHAFLNFSFFSLGKVVEIVVELDLHILDTLIIFLLSYLEIDFTFNPLSYWPVAPSQILAAFLTWVTRMFQPAGAVDFQSFDEASRIVVADPGVKYAVSAPTGTGKSTRMMARLQATTGLKVLVVVPRRSLAMSVGDYMKLSYPYLGVGVDCEGRKSEPTDRLVYMTPDSFLLKHRQNKSAVLVLDEAHINEPVYNVVRSMVLSDPTRRALLMTATPDLTWNVTRLKVPAVNQFQVATHTQLARNLDDYVQKVRKILHARTAFEKVLVFLPTVKLCEKLATEFKGASAFTSKSLNVPQGNIIFSTSVADAGITLPDVSFVISSDVDISVTTIELEKGERPYMFKLPQSTIIQRKGRTGRTNDGTFFLFKLQEDELPLGKALSDYDYIDACRHVLDIAAPFLPSGSRSLLNCNLRHPIVRAFAQTELISLKDFMGYIERGFSNVLSNMLVFRSKTSVADVTRFLVLEFNSSGVEPISADKGPYSKPIQERLESDLMIEDRKTSMDRYMEAEESGSSCSGSNSHTSVSEVHEAGGSARSPHSTVSSTNLSALSVDATGVDAFDPYEVPLQWGKVSGSGLLCGSRALRAAWFEATGELVMTQWFTTLCQAVVDPEFHSLGDFMSFFSADQLLAVCELLGAKLLLWHAEPGSALRKIDFNRNFSKDDTVLRIKLEGEHYENAGDTLTLPDHMGLPRSTHRQLALDGDPSSLSLPLARALMQPRTVNDLDSLTESEKKALANAIEGLNVTLDDIARVQDAEEDLRTRSIIACVYLYTNPPT